MLIEDPIGVWLTLIALRETKKSVTDLYLRPVSEYKILKAICT